jgi:hypothetical protein
LQGVQRSTSRSCWKQDGRDDGGHRLAAGYMVMKSPKGAKEDLLAVLKGVVNLAGSGGGAGDARGADILASPFFIP